MIGYRTLLNGALGTALLWTAIQLLARGGIIAVVLGAGILALAAVVFFLALEETR